MTKRGYSESLHRSAGAVCDVVLWWQHLQLGPGTSKKSDGHQRILPFSLPLLKKRVKYDIYGQLAH